MKKLLQNILTFTFFATIMVFSGIGIQKTYEFAANLPSRITVTTDKDLPDTGWQLKEPLQSAKRTNRAVQGACFRTGHLFAPLAGAETFVRRPEEIEPVIFFTRFTAKLQWPR